MDTYCLILTGAYADPDAAAAQARLAAAFGMSPEAFDAKVWQRAPLIIRQQLDQATADRQVAQLGELGARACALPTDDSLIWLLRDGRTLGPLPATALQRFGQPGDRWCHDGDTDWQELTPATAPPPLPVGRKPPPLPESPAQAPLLRHVRWLAGAAVLLVLAAIGLHWHKPSPAPTPPVRYVPRPLQPMAKSPPATSSGCADATGAVPTSEEDRFLLAGGRRQLTGRARRQGDNYVAEAVVGRDGHCQPDAVQLYVFHQGVFVGTPIDPPIDPRHAQLTDFSLDPQGVLDYTVRRCKGTGDACGPTERFRVHLKPSDSGWVLAYEGAPGTASVEIVSRTAPQYPDEALRQHHEGTVLLAFTIGADGVPLDIKVAQSSGFAELDAAALAAARQWRFRALAADGHATTASTRVPVHFHLDKP